MQFEMTKCNQCGADMLMGLTTCPSCGRSQTASTRSGSLRQPGTLLAVVLAAAVLFIFNWMKSPGPHMNQITARPSATLPSQ